MPVNRSRQAHDLIISDYEVIATLGPSCADAAVWEKLLAAGASAFRLNSSHLTVDELTVWLNRLEAFFEARGSSVEVVIDLQGSKWRLGTLEPRFLDLDQQVTLILAEAVSPGSNVQTAVLPVPRADFFRAAPLSDGEVVLNDAKVRLRIEGIQENAVIALVTQAGPVSARKGITLPGSSYRSEALSKKDHEIVTRTRQWSFASYAISYVKDAVEMRRYRAVFDALPGKPPKLIAKLERAQAMDEASEIAQALLPNGALWVCRGDLGAEVGLPAMAQAVHHLTQQIGSIPAPLLMAGQVLEHMTLSPNPTRSEVCYLHDCLRAGYRGFILSDEAAAGPYPVESCRAAAVFRQALGTDPILT